MQFSNYSTMFQEANKNTLEEFKVNVDPMTLVDGINDFLKEGAPLMKIGAKSEVLQKALLNGTKILNSIKQRSHFLFNVVTKDIVNISNVEGFANALKLIKEIREEAGDMFYGALLVDNKKNILNPLHISTAMLLSNRSKYEYWYEKEYKLLIYTYNNKDDYKNCVDIYNFNDIEKDEVTKIVNNLVILSSKQIESQIKIQDIEFNNMNATITYKIKKDETEDPNYELYLSAHQILTKGIVMPYYGASVIKMNGDTSGCHITPMLSCNISTVNNKPNEINWNAVCTGSISNATLKGLRTLNHANLNSPYNEGIIAKEAMEFAKQCVDKSLEIYKEAEII